MSTISLQNSAPVEYVNPPEPGDPQVGGKPATYEDGSVPADAELIKFVVAWRSQLRTERLDKRNIWNECWQLYRGLEDFASKEDWQAKLVLPKAFASVKQATNVVQRLLSSTKDPWMLEPYDKENQVSVLRADKATELTRAFLDRAKYTTHFVEGLECGFITGVGVWKLWWGLVPRTRVRVETVPVPQPGMAQQAGIGEPMQPAAPPGVAPGAPAPTGVPMEAPVDFSQPYPVGQQPKELMMQDDKLYPTQLPNEALGALGGPPPAPAPQVGAPPMQKQIIREEIVEGQLFLRAVDPYNFYWLPGSKFNAWTGTLEEMEIPKWELMDLAKSGVFGPDGEEKVANIGPMRIDETDKQSYLRFSERSQNNTSPSAETSNVKLVEYFGPIICNGKLLTKFGHLLIANDTKILINTENNLWTKKPPYVAYSPLKQPFRVDGVGIIEAVREIQRALGRIANLSVDTLMYRLLPLFEVNMDAFESPEDFETGMTPGKLFRRNRAFAGQPGINPIRFDDISQGSLQVSAELDRSYQEGAFVSEIQQGIPRYRGVQSATEISTKEENQNSFFGAMASQIEQEALLPIVQMAFDLIFQFIDTSNDPRIASILGVDANIIAGISREELMEMIQGDYEIKVTGITGQLQKAEMLQNLVQVMNIIGQNAEAWLPYLNQDELLRRILESFRPSIHDIEKIIADPETVAANKAAVEGQQMTPEMLRMIPQLAEQAHRVEMEKQKAAQEQQAQQVQMVQQQFALKGASQQVEKTDVEIALLKKELNAPLPKPAPAKSKS